MLGVHYTEGQRLEFCFLFTQNMISSVLKYQLAVSNNGSLSLKAVCHRSRGQNRGTIDVCISSHDFTLISLCWVMYSASRRLSFILFRPLELVDKKKTLMIIISNFNLKMPPFSMTSSPAFPSEKVHNHHNHPYTGISFIWQWIFHCTISNFISEMLFVNERGVYFPIQGHWPSDVSNVGLAGKDGFPVQPGRCLYCRLLYGLNEQHLVDSLSNHAASPHNTHTHTHTQQFLSQPVCVCARGAGLGLTRWRVWPPPSDSALTTSGPIEWGCPWNQTTSYQSGQLQMLCTN